MRVIITGGTGFIGKAIAENFLKDNHEVILLSRNPSNAKNIPSGARVEKWDAKTGEGWSSLINADTAIVNMAGESIGIPPFPWTAARKQKIYDSRINAGQAVVDAIQKSKMKPRVVVQSSAVGYYGKETHDKIVTEDSPAGTDFLAGICIDWEASTKSVENLGIRRVVIRTGLPLDKDKGVLPYLALPFKLFVGGPIGSGRQYIPWIHLADYVNAIRFLIDNDKANGAYNLSSPNPLTNADLGRVLGRAMHRPSFFPVPGFALKLILGELAEYLLLTGQREIPQRLQQAGFKFQFADAETALRDIMR